MVFHYIRDTPAVPLVEALRGAVMSRVQGEFMRAARGSPFLKRCEQTCANAAAPFLLRHHQFAQMRDTCVHTARRRPDQCAIALRRDDAALAGPRLGVNRVPLRVEK